MLTLALQQLTRRQIADQSPVRCKKLVLRKVLKLDPLELMEDLVLQFAFKRSHREELQVDGATVTVIMANVRDLWPDGGPDPQLLLQFARESLFWCFALLNLSAGKFPLQCHWLVRAPLADEHQAIASQQPCNHKPKCGARRARVGDRLRLFHLFSVNGWQSAEAWGR